jgi:hypothetical protein
MNICPGDSYKINTFGHLTQGFVISHYLIQTTYNNNSNNTEVYFWFLIDKHNMIVCFRGSDVINTSRIVLIEKLKYPVKLNEELNNKMLEARQLLINRQSIHRARQIGMSASFAQSVVLNCIKNFGIPDKKITIIAGNKNKVISSCCKTINKNSI